MAYSLPHDTLREIGKHWAGHRLLYTCTALYTSWNPDEHVVTERKTFIEPTYREFAQHITIFRMPNGVYHGECVNTLRYLAGGNPGHETIEYYRGSILAITYQDALTRRCQAATIINGRLCRWWPNSGGVGPAAQESLGCVFGGNHVREDVKFRDFGKVARELCALAERGTTSQLTLQYDWGGPMPGVKC